MKSLMRHQKRDCILMMPLFGECLLDLQRWLWRGWRSASAALARTIEYPRAMATAMMRPLCELAEFVCQPPMQRTTVGLQQTRVLLILQDPQGAGLGAAAQAAARQALLAGGAMQHPSSPHSCYFFR